MARERSRMLQLLADQARAATGPLIIMGDLNATPWCQDMRPMWSAGLRDARRGPRFGPTWQAGNPLFAIPIDHLLLKGAVAVESCLTGPPLGSDHRGLVGVLRL
jgi:vancomycin resistance protein VanJ